MRAPSIYYWRVRKNCFFALWSGALARAVCWRIEARCRVERLMAAEE